ncbi:unnamed protein product [Dimorphilus gyrociliatus]|uniref:Uncharacterized protein n=1 Tax=Dimorphilus gyrociliatus TaxID=2664684 RepID=A0A7I8WD18_9ANNE|nr:unnamed protein product [Dimorphilus gyrociliatus]
MDDLNWATHFKSLINAKYRNMLEDVKLQRQLTNLTMEKVRSDRERFNELYEQRQVSFKLRKEILDKEKNKKRKLEDQQQVSIRKNEYGKIHLFPQIAVVENVEHSSIEHSPPSIGRNSSQPKAIWGFLTGFPRRKSSIIPLTKPLLKDNYQNTAIREEPRKEIAKLPVLPPLNRGRKILLNGSAASSKKWAGEPSAIRSVRRKRREPNQMAARQRNLQTYVKIKRQIKDVAAGNCSKRCGKNGKGQTGLVVESQQYRTVF